MANNLFTLGLDVSATKITMDKQLKQIAKELSNNKSILVAGGLDITQSQKIIQQQLNDISKSLKVEVQVDTSAMKQQMNTVNQQMTSGVNSTNNSVIDLQNNVKKTDLTKLEQQFRGIQAQTVRADTSSQGFFGNLKTQLIESVGLMLKYQLANKIIQETINSIKSMVTAVIDLDGVLTEFNKVADLSKEQLTDFSDRAYNAATKIGRSGSDMIEAATEFKRAGYELESSLEMGDAALVMTNVADGITQTSDAASTLIAVLKGFDVDETSIMDIVDKMNSVSNQSPVGFDNLADGLERVSGTMNQAGNSIDETIGMLTGGFSQLRNMEKVSTGLITISQRLRGVGEDEEAIDGLSAKLGQSFGEIGIAIEDSEGNLRSTYDILSDYARVYPDLTSKQRQYIGELAAGKNRITVFNAIVDEMATVDKAVNQSIDSIGSAEKENEIYRQSIQGMQNEMENQFQLLANEVISSDWIKDLISAGTDFLEVLTNIVKQDDLVSGTIGVITDIIKDLASALKDLSGNDVFGSLMKSFLTYQTVTKGIDIFNFLKGKNDSKQKMDSFFESAINGTLQLKDGFIEVGKAKDSITGFGRQELLVS